jgi:hypothetical protein
VTTPVPSRTARPLAALVLLATVGQLAVAGVATDLPQFAGKGFAARLVLYPVMMLLVPALWWLRHRRTVAAERSAAPWSGFALVMAPFLIDVTGNTLDLYDTVTWWDDANHFVNWFLLCLGLALVLGVQRVQPAWVRWTVVVGAGAVLAVVWELGEWFAFIRYGKELSTAYRDTLGDEALGTGGAALAALVIARWARPGRSAAPSRGASVASSPTGR